MKHAQLVRFVLISVFGSEQNLMRHFNARAGVSFAGRRSFGADLTVSGWPHTA